MATFEWNNLTLYYEDKGQGQPFMVLNGIFMSCSSWQAFIPAFSQNNRLIIMDFPDQGKSDKMQQEYTQDMQAEAAVALLDYLGIQSTSLMGISYGGEVAMKVASRWPGRISKLVLANTTAYTSHWLRDIGHSWEYAFKSNDGHQFFKTCIPIVYSPEFYEKNYEWAAAREELFVKAFTPEVYAAFGRLTRSAQNHDERQNLCKITAKTLVISSDYDFVTPPYQQKEIAEAIPDAGQVTIQDAGHAVMYEKPAEFSALVLGFINTDLNIRTL